MPKEKTVQDFNIRISKAKQLYLKQKMDYNLNYKFKEETFDTSSYFLITNSLQATKLIFNPEMGVIVEDTIYISDLTNIMELKESL